jgi:hypothetical protein
MLQVENEFGGPAGSKGGSYAAGSNAAKYLGWAVDMARAAAAGVPWLLCHDVDQCTQINHGGAIPYNTSAYDYKVGLYPIATLQYSSTTPYQVAYHIQ